MKTLSHWAKNHPISARWILAFGHIFTLLNGLLLGSLLYLNDLSIPPFVMGFCMILIGAAYLAYPFREARSGFFRYSYGKQKTMDFVFVAAAALLISTATCQFAYETPAPTATTVSQLQIYPVVERGPSPQEEQIQRPSQRTLKASIRAQKQLIKQELRTLKAEWKQAKDSGGQGVAKVLLILLTIVVALALAYIIAALACAVACNGNDALAVGLLLAGWTGIIFLSVVVIRGILRMGRNKLPQEVPGN